MGTTLTETSSNTPEQKSSIPYRLVNGDNLTAREFHRLYLNHPDETKFELLKGRVFVTPPVYEPHGQAHAGFGGLLATYSSLTPGIRVAGNVTVRLDEMNEVQPDGYARILESHGGQTKSPLDEKGMPTFIIGAPELVVEIAGSSRSIDFGDKLDSYRATGVREYLVWSLHDSTLHWFELPSLNKLAPDELGVIRSKILPGLWISPELLLKRDFMACVALLQEAAKSDEHRAFVAKLNQAAS